MPTHTPTLRAPPNAPPSAATQVGCAGASGPRLLIEEVDQGPRLVPIVTRVWMHVGSAIAAEVPLHTPTAPALCVRLYFDGDVVTLEPIDPQQPNLLEGRRLRGSTLWAPGARLALGGCCITLLGARPGADTSAEALTLREHLEATERRVLAHALRTCDHNQSRAARQLGISRRALIYKLERYGLKAAPNSEPPSATEE